MTVKVDMDRVLPRLIGNVERAQRILDSQVMADTSVYVPAESLNLRNEGIRASFNPGEIEWPGPYAAKQYYEFPNKSTAVHPLASMRWFEVAKAANLAKWLRVAKKAGGR